VPWYIYHHKKLLYGVLFRMRANASAYCAVCVCKCVCKCVFVCVCVCTRVCACVEYFSEFVPTHPYTALHVSVSV